MVSYRPPNMIARSDGLRCIASAAKWPESRGNPFDEGLCPFGALFRSTSTDLRRRSCRFSPLDGLLGYSEARVKGGGLIRQARLKLLNTSLELPVPLLGRAHALRGLNS